MSVIVLIVDDDKSVRFFHRIIVSQSGLAAAPLDFAEAASALTYLDNHHLNNIDTYLVLLDINMPVMNGWELLDILRTRSYHDRVHVVMITSSVDRADHEKANGYSMVMKVIEKPLSAEACKKIMEISPLAEQF